MNLPQHPNPIIRHAVTAKQQMPSGAGQHKTKHKHNPRQGTNRPCIEYVGLGLVEWLLDNDRLDEAREMLKSLEK